MAYNIFPRESTRHIIKDWHWKKKKRDKRDKKNGIKQPEKTQNGMSGVESNHSDLADDFGQST